MTKVYFHIPADVKEWPTENEEEALEMARIVRATVSDFITKNKLDAIALVATNDKCAQLTEGDPEVIKKLEDFVSELFSNLVKEQQ